MPVQISTRGLGRAPGIAPSTVAGRARRILEALGQAEAELSVLLCDDETIAELNEQYRGKQGPTDVLSFPQQEGAPLPSEGPVLLGDVVISLPTARRQAPSGEGGLRQEVTRLLAHGILHLLGWVHDTPERLAAMEAETERLIALAEGR